MNPILKSDLKSEFADISPNLTGDLRFENGGTPDVSWFAIYEIHPLFKSQKLIYLKVVIHTIAGRFMAQENQREILDKCDFWKTNAAYFTRALSLAMSVWDGSTHN